MNEDGPAYSWHEVPVVKMDTPRGLARPKCSCGWQSEGFFGTGSRELRQCGDQHVRDKHGVYPDLQAWFDTGTQGASGADL